MLSWIHLGDPHVADSEEQNVRDLHAIVEEANACLAGNVDFALLAGDIANEGTVEQYRRVRGALDGLRLPINPIPGDHDFEPGNLAAFHGTLGAPMLPKRELIGDHSRLFLDVVSAGNGGPDVRLGAAQLEWLERQLRDADAADLHCVVFIHVYPADLGRDAERVVDLFGRHRVAFVAMGHTHYNELSNDGRLIHAAVRSARQVQEGPVGFALTVLEDEVASWRFKLSSGKPRLRCRAWSTVTVVGADTVGAWPEKGIHGGEPGPNRNGSKW